MILIMEWTALQNLRKFCESVSPCLCSKFSFRLANIRSCFFQPSIWLTLNYNIWLTQWNILVLKQKKRLANILLVPVKKVHLTFQNFGPIVQIQVYFFAKFSLEKLTFSEMTAKIRRSMKKLLAKYRWNWQSYQSSLHSF